MLELKDLQDLHDKAYTHNQVTRQKAADDQLFYWVTQWDDNLLGESSLGYRGEFNIIRKAGRQILGDLRGNPVQVDFDPKGETEQDGADLLDGIYRSTSRENTSIEAFDNAAGEAVVCGYGAWELYTEYESNRIGDEKQVIRRRPIYEANNNAYPDPNAKLADKSDGLYWSVLTAYSEDGYSKLVKDLTGRDEDYGESFKWPEQSYAFPWYAESNKIYVVSFYHKEKVKEKILTLADPFGSELMVRETGLEEVEDELLDAGYEIVSEKTIERWQVTKYTASGVEILSTDIIPGEHIPVIPTYGERAFIEGEEHWEGVTRLAKDPQRLRNFQMSYLADIVSRSPRPKPIFTQDQIGRFAHMYEENGADNNYPYLLQESKDANGAALPIGPVAVMPEQTVPTALVASLELSRQAVEDVANPGIPQDIADPDLSGKAVNALQMRFDQQSIVYQQNLKHAHRHDGVVYASMASEVIDSPRKMMTTLPDGQKKQVQIMETVIDRETGDAVTLNDLTGAEFDVYADIGPSYASMREQTIERLTQIYQSMDPSDPARRMILLKLLKLSDGVDLEDVREYANRELIMMGVKEPETDEEKEMVANAQQSQQPDPMMVAAMAEDKKGQAALMSEERQMMKAQADIQNDQAGTQIDAFDSQTKRMDTQVSAEKAGAEIELKRIEVFGKQISEQQARRERFMGRISQPSMAGRA